MTPRSKADHERHNFIELDDSAKHSAQIVTGPPAGTTNSEPIPVTFSSTSGSTISIQGVADTVTDLPTSAAGIITEVKVKNLEEEVDHGLEVSWDSTTWDLLPAGDAMIWEPKGNITQFKIRKSGTNTAAYSITINRKT